MLMIKRKISLLESKIVAKKILLANDFSQTKKILSSPKYIVGSILGGLTLGFILFAVKIKKTGKNTKKTPKNVNPGALPDLRYKFVFLLLTFLISIMRVIHSREG